MIARFKARCLITQERDKFRIKVIDGPEAFVSKSGGQLMVRDVVLLAPKSFDSRAQQCIYEPSVRIISISKIIDVLNGIGDYRNYWVEANLELMILSLDGVKWEVTIEDAEPITNARFKEEESGMKTLTIHNVEATLYFWNGCKLAYIENGEYERRIKERCESLGYDKKPFDKYNYSNQFGDGVRFIVNDYTGPTIPDIPDERYLKMDCDVIIKDTDDFDVVNIKCNQIIHAYSECKEEENTMLKKETNKAAIEGYFARAAARRYTEYRQRRDQIRAPVAPAIMDIKFNGPATIIFWGDGTKTVVKQHDGEATYDKEKAIAMALIKKSYPGHAYHKLFNLDEYFGKQLRAAEKKRDSILSQIKDARKPKVTARLEQELYKIDDEIARLKKEVEKFE